MGPHHLERVEALGGDGKTYLLTAFAGAGPVGRAISDPLGETSTSYRATADELERESPARVRPDRRGARPPATS